MQRKLSTPPLSPGPTSSGYSADWTVYATLLRQRGYHPPNIHASFTRELRALADEPGWVGPAGSAGR